MFIFSLLSFFQSPITTTSTTINLTNTTHTHTQTKKKKKNPITTTFATRNPPSPLWKNPSPPPLPQETHHQHREKNPPLPPGTKPIKSTTTSTHKTYKTIAKKLTKHHNHSHNHKKLATMPPPNLETKQQPNPDTGHNNHKKNLSTLMSTPISTTATSMPPRRSQLRHLPCHHIGLHANLNYATQHASTLISNTRVRIEATLPQRERERDVGDGETMGDSVMERIN